MNSDVEEVNVRASVKKSWKLCDILREITVEPALFLTIFSSVMYQLTTQTFLLEKTCRYHFALNNSICDSMTVRNSSGYGEDQEIEVHEFVSKMYTVSTIIQGVFPVLLLLFLGSWSDKYNKRKPLILAPILGEMLALLSLILNTIFMDIPVVVTTLMVFLPPALTGGWPCLFLGAYSYISAKSSNENKTISIGVCSSAYTLAFILGASSSGFILSIYGFIGVYSLGFVLTLIAFVYTSFKIHDLNIGNRKITENWNIFQIEYIVKTLKLCLRNRNDRTRWRILVIMMASALILGVMQGEYYVVYLYTRLKFGWDEVDFSIFTLSHSLMDILGCCISLIILSKFLKWKDASLGIIALCFSICSSITYALAPTGTIFYAGIITDIFYGTSSIALRSILVKIVPDHDLGKSNSIFEICEALVPAIFGPLYTTVYKYSIKYFPGALYCISIAMYLAGLALFTWLYFQERTDEEMIKLEELERTTCLPPIVKNDDKITTD